jgi:cytochrome P450
MIQFKSFPALKGSSLLLGHMPLMQKDTYDFYLRQHRSNGDSLRFRAFPMINFYSFSSPDAIHHVLTKARHKYSRGKRWSGIVSLIGGNGIITSTGGHWQQQRQCITPYFTPAHVEKYASRIVNNTLSLMEGGWNLPQGTEINISRAMMSLGLINVSDILFNYDMRRNATLFSEAMMDGFFYINRFIQNPLTPPSFLPTRANRLFKQKKAVADTVVREIIDTIRKEDEDCMINALIKAGNSDEQLHDEIITLLMAGHDTLSTALAWTWYLLARHPDVLKKLQEELDAELKGEPPTAQSIDRLVYTRMVFKETLRLYPSAWAIHRFSEEADEVEGYPVRKGSSVVLPVYVTHRHPDYWSHPETFYPEHFSKAESEGRPRFAYVPFGAGEHVCVGAQLATIEGILILATILQKFVPTLKDNENITPLVNFTLKPERDIIGIAVRRPIF